jgi:hypothetical protein
MTAKNGSTEWWLNRKSRIGHSPAAKAPPHVNGEPWWTTPPVSAPEPEFIEYAVAYRQELITKLNGSRGPERRKVDELVRFVNTWLNAARRLLHERLQAPERADLHTTDGLIIAASRALHMMRSRIYGLGGEVDEEIRAIMDAVQARADGLRRERALNPRRASPTSRRP